MGDHAMTTGFYKSSDWLGGAGTPDSIYPELKETEGIKVVVGTGPAGENVLDLNTVGPETYGSMEATFDAIGAIATAHSTGWWNATEGHFTIQYFFNTAAWDDQFFEYILFGVGIPTFPDDFLLYIDASTGSNPPVGGVLTLDARTFSGGRHSIFQDSFSVLRGDTVGGIAVENAWQTIEVIWRCGTVTGAFASVASDGFIQVKWNGQSIYNLSGIDLCLNPGQDLNQNATAAGTDLAAIQNLARAFVLGNAGIFGPSTNIELLDTATPPPPDPPPVTTDFRLVAGDGMVVLGWSATSGATTYNVKRGLTSGSEVTIANVAASQFADPAPPGFTLYGFYADATVVNGVTYFYTITGVNGAGESVPSTELTAQPVLPSGPIYGPDAFVGMDQMSQDLFRETYWIEFQDAGIPVTGGTLGPNGELVLMRPSASPTALTTGVDLAQAVWGKVLIPEGPYGSFVFDGWIRTATNHAPANDFRVFVFGLPPIVNPTVATWAFDAGALVPSRSVFGFQLASGTTRSLQFLFIDRDGTTLLDQTFADVMPDDLPEGAWHSYRMEWRLSVPEGTANGCAAFFVDEVRVAELNCIDLYTVLGDSRWNVVNGSQVGGVTNVTYLATVSNLPSCGNALLTQLPVEVAYDYAMLQPFIKGGGLNWITPPKTLT